MRYHNLFLTKEQIVEAYGEPSFLFKDQLESYYYKMLGDEFRFRNITLFTGTSDEKAVQGFISDYYQVKLVQNEQTSFFL